MASHAFLSSFPTNDYQSSRHQSPTASDKNVPSATTATFLLLSTFIPHQNFLSLLPHRLLVAAVRGELVVEVSKAGPNDVSTNIEIWNIMISTASFHSSTRVAYGLRCSCCPRRSRSQIRQAHTTRRSRRSIRYRGCSTSELRRLSIDSAQLGLRWMYILSVNRAS
jgi:hypothetical protein